MIENLGRMKKVSVILTPEAFDTYCLLTEALGEESPAGMIDRSVSLMKLFVDTQGGGSTIVVRKKRKWWKLWLFPETEILCNLKNADNPHDSLR